MRVRLRHRNRGTEGSVPTCEPRATQSANRFGMWASMIENRGRVKQQYLSTNLSLPKRSRSNSDTILLLHRGNGLFEHVDLRGHGSEFLVAGSKRRNFGVVLFLDRC